MKAKKFSGALIIFALLVGLFLGGMQLTQVSANSTGFDDITVLNAAVTKNLTVAGTSALAGNVSAAADLAVNGNATVTGQSRLKVPVMTNNAFTVTNNMTLTVAYGSYDLNAAGAVGLILNPCTVDGQLVTLYGEDAQTVTVADTNIRTSDGSVVAIGQYDIATFQCFKTEWVLINKLANS